jgi:hypothetical protein
VGTLIEGAYAGAMTTSMRGDYAFEKCIQAANYMAVSADPFAKRVSDAWVHALARLHKEHMEDEAWGKLEEARQEVDRISGDRGPLETVLSGASAEDVSGLAEKIWAVVAHVAWRPPSR